MHSHESYKPLMIPYYADCQAAAAYVPVSEHGHVNHDYGTQRTHQIPTCSMARAFRYVGGCAFRAWDVVLSSNKACASSCTLCLLWPPAAWRPLKSRIQASTRITLAFAAAAAALMAVSPCKGSSGCQSDDLARAYRTAASVPALRHRACLLCQYECHARLCCIPRLVGFELLWVGTSANFCDVRVSRERHVLTPGRAPRRPQNV